MLQHTGEPLSQNARTPADGELLTSRFIRVTSRALPV